MSVESAPTPSVPVPKGFGPRLCTSWTRFYTRRLPDGIREARRAEITSDLWEHGCDAAESSESSVHVNVSIVGRVLSGIPADLSWRRETLRSQRAVATGGTAMTTRVPTFADRALIVLAVVGASVAATLLPLLGLPDDELTAADFVWLLSAVLLGVALVVGLVLRDRRPSISTALLVIGSLAPAVSWYWLPPMWLLSIGIAAAALISARGRSRTVTTHA